MIRGVICTGSIVLLLCMLLPIMPVDAKRDEATVAGNWTFDDGTAKDSL